MQPQSPPDDTQRPAFASAFERVDEAVGLSRQRDSGQTPDDYQFRRYMALREDPQALLAFVAESLGTRNPEQIRAGALAYLDEMEAKYAK